MDYAFRRQDAIAGVILIAFSLFIIVESWRMPRDLLGFPAYAGPGMVTGLLGLGLLVMGLALLMRALRRPGARVAVSRAEIRAYLDHPQTRRLGLVLLISSAYLLSLGRGIPYYITTGAYLVLTMAVFRAAAWWVILLVSGLATAGLAIVFNVIFLVPLP
jgi:hypothetical protein